MKKIITLFGALLVLLSISSCNSFGVGSGSAVREPTPAAREPTPIDTFSLSCAPKLGETTEFTFLINLRFYTNFGFCN